MNKRGPQQANFQVCIYKSFHNSNLHGLVIFVRTKVARSCRLAARYCTPSKMTCQISVIKIQPPKNAKSEKY